MLRQEQVSERLTSDESQAAEAALDWLCNTYLRGDADLLDRCLSASGTDRQHVLPALIDRKIAGGSQRRSRWQVLLDNILAKTESIVPDASTGVEDFTIFFHPFLRHATARLDQHIQSVAPTTRLKFAESALRRQFLKNLVERLSSCGLRVIVLEMHKARMSGTTAGGTTEERFARFARDSLMNADWMRETLHGYPVLARMLVTVTDSAVRAWSELISRLASDFDTLRTGPSLLTNASTLVSVKSDRGDRHGDGRAVALLEFDSGERLVYKPRAMSLAARFQDFLRWLAAEGLDPPLRVIGVLDRGEYGWAEFVRPLPCVDVAEVRRFYLRQGILLANLYVLDAADCHMENIIASGESPVLVDLETIFHNQADLSGECSSNSALRDAVFTQTVLRASILPQHFEGPAGIADISALGGASDQKTPYLVPKWEGLGTDEMRLVVDSPGVLPPGHNRPLVDGNPVPILDHRDAVIEGFERGYRFLLSKRDALLAPGGPVDAFRGCAGRHVVWATHSYAQLIGESCHPSCLVDSMEREFVIDDLWMRVDRYPYLKQLVASEKAAIWNLDVPYFQARTESRDLWDENGRRFENYFAVSSLDRVRGRIQNISERDLQIQSYAVRMSLASLDLRGGPPVGQGPPNPNYTSDGTLLVDAAKAVGERVIALMLESNNEGWWLGLEPLGTDRYNAVVLGTDLYSGSSGIALFLAWLGHLTGEARFSAAARKAIAAGLREMAGEANAFGAFTGSVGALYSASHLSWLWSEPGLLTNAAKVFDNLTTRLEEDVTFDIIAGAAGSLMLALAVYDAVKDSIALKFACVCADHLITHAEANEDGLAWRTQGPEKACLYGFAHGIAGIGFALARLALVTAEPRYYEAAIRAFARERAGYVADQENWPDFRQHEGNGNPQSAGWAWAWCHGAAGIGLARAGLVRDRRDFELRDDIERAVSSVLKRGFGGNLCLCHGDLGNAEFLHVAGQALGRPDLVELALGIARSIIKAYKDEGKWPCGTAGGLEVPGLMIGLAGIGYQFLRLAYPDRVPSILLLDTPGSFGAAAH